jgi:hypothetical protein
MNGRRWPLHSIGMCRECGTPHAGNEADGVLRIANEGDLATLTGREREIVGMAMREAPVSRERADELIALANRG